MRYTFCVPVHLVFEVDADSHEAAYERASRLLQVLEEDEQPFAAVPPAAAAVVSADIVHTVSAAHLFDVAP
jgi:hypothetical protein